ncbi:MAG: LacI family DNA-binding transcriptional regulator [Nocardioidaceae bacterium]
MVTMREVAERAGVSAKTVSRVLRNDRYVSDDVRARVNAAVAELQYVPNMLAVTFRSGRDAAIGIAVPDVADPFFAQVVQAVEQEARARSTAVIVTSLGYDPAYEQAAVETLLQRRVVGLISCPVSADQSYLAGWVRRTPVVFVDRAPVGLTADCVIEDDRGGAHLATRHLLEHGHRRIVFIGDDLNAATTRERLHGYADALAEAGATVDEELVHLGTTAPPTIDRVLERLTQMSDPPSAVFSSNARCTLSVFPALRRLAGDGLCLVSFGDFPMAASLDPAVTVIDQNPAAVGTFAARRLFRRIDEPTKRLRRRTVLPVSLTERDSCRLPVRTGPTGAAATSG